MSLDLIGVVFFKEEQLDKQITTKIFKIVEEIYNKNFQNTIKKFRPDDYTNYIKEPYNFVEITKYFSRPQIYTIPGLNSNITFSIYNELSSTGNEVKGISFLNGVDTEEMKEYQNIIGDENLLKYTNCLWISLDDLGSSQEIMETILIKFGNKSPAYLINKELTESFDIVENVKKIGKYKII